MDSSIKQSTDSQPSDQELIALWKGGDSRAATELVERHSEALARFAASSGVGATARDEIEELVQDTFVRAFNAIDSFRGESSLRTWLFTIERRLMLDRRRAEKRRWKLGMGALSLDEIQQDAVGVVQTDYDALDDIVADEAETRVKKALQSLSGKQREIFLLRVEQGLSYKEIADVAGTTEGAARVHYHNAMHAVKEYLSND